MRKITSTRTASFGVDLSWRMAVCLGKLAGLPELEVGGVGRVDGRANGLEGVRSVMQGPVVGVGVELAEVTTGREGDKLGGAPPGGVTGRGPGGGGGVDIHVGREGIVHEVRAAAATKVPAENEGFNAGVAAAFGLDDSDPLKVLLHLRVHEAHVLAAEYLGQECAARLQDKRGDVERRQDQLRLYVLVYVVQSSDVRGAVRNDNVGLAAGEVVDDLLCSRHAGYVPLDLENTREWGHVLKIHRHDPRLPRIVAFWVETATQHLAPAPRRRAEVHSPLHTLENAKLVVDLHQLECRSCPPPFDFSFPIVNVAFVFALFPHLRSRSFSPFSPYFLPCVPVLSFQFTLLSLSLSFLDSFSLFLSLFGSTL
mmetsp:Transcript_14213/g.40382  ORF Transcript_14213/g.40382 Transcript_14213/m.40382 type:complete len:368 (-) Transcript_14213:30-1133(-)